MSSHPAVIHCTSKLNNGQEYRKVKEGIKKEDLYCRVERDIGGGGVFREGKELGDGGKKGVSYCNGRTERGRGVGEENIMKNLIDALKVRKCSEAAQAVNAEPRLRGRRNAA